MHIHLIDYVEDGIEELVIDNKTVLEKRNISAAEALQFVAERIANMDDIRGIEFQYSVYPRMSDVFDYQGD